jgi:hypothetical protein
MNGIRHFVRTNDYFIKLLGAACLLLMLGLTAGCGEDAFVCVSDDCVQPSNNTGTTTGGTTGGTGTSGSTTSGITMTASMSPSTLASGETSSVTVQIRNSDGTAYSNIVTLNLTTTCSSSTIPATANTSAGIATVSYIAGNCTGSDTITASATVDAEPLTATVIANVTAPTINIQMGRGSGVSFQQNLLQTGTGAASDGQAALAAGGSTSVTATLVDADNSFALYGTPTSISFSSACEAAGNATITSPVNTNGGSATTTYVATGCSGDDTITASATIGTTVLTAQRTITVAAATVGSVQFVSADPSIIAIAGTGGGGLQETSTLTFAVVDSLGGGISGQVVNFALNTNVGGIQLSAISGVTQADGTVQVTVQSGTIPTPVNVTATTTDLASGIDYSTQSDALVISTGRADQNSFSISVLGGCNVPEAWEMDGVTRTVNIYAADHFNNPVPDGTSVSFRTEGGAIDGSCQTANGGCTVTWRSQAPRPGDGRATILATAIGNESYLDANSNGGYDDGDPLFTDVVAGGEDLGEAWLDINDNFSYDSGVEEFIDFNLDGVYNVGDGLFTGVLCYRTGGCSTSRTLHVREWITIVMNQRPTASNVSVGTIPNPLTSTAVQVNITVRDGNNQFPAAGTTISVETTNGTIVGPTSFSVPSTCSLPPGAGYTATITMQSDGVASNDGVLTVTITPPGADPIYVTVTGINDI